MKFNKNNLIKICLALVTFIFFDTKVFAASFSVSASSKSIIVGKTGSVRISGSDVTGKFSVSSSNSGVVSITGDSTPWIENDTASIGIKANKLGSATITIKAVDVSNNSGVNVSLGSKSITINVVEAPKPSSNSNLKSLGIEGIELTPAFSKDVLEYSAEIPADTSKIKVTGEVEDGTASVSGIGEIDVLDGANNLEVKVTAQDGNSKTYKINANVIVKDPIEVKIDKNKYFVVRKMSELLEIPSFEKSTTTINKEEVPALINKKAKITLVGLKNEKGEIKLYSYDSKNKKYSLYQEVKSNEFNIYLSNFDKVPNGYKKYDVKIQDKNISVYKRNKDSDYMLVYGTNLTTGNKGWYLFDSKENTLQRYYTLDIEKTNQIVLYEGIGLGVLVISNVVSILLLLKRKKKSK